MYASLNEDRLEDASKCLDEKYSIDLSNELVNEMVHLKRIFRSTFASDKELVPLQMPNEIYIKKLRSIFGGVRSTSYILYTACYNRRG